jgi:hypothetical protein
MEIIIANDGQMSFSQGNCLGDGLGGGPDEGGCDHCHDSLFEYCMKQGDGHSSLTIEYPDGSGHGYGSGIFGNGDCIIY